MSERKSLRVEIKDAEKGVVTAAFAKTGSKDLDGDFTLPGAFGSQSVRVSSYGHGSWMGELPVGKGTITEKDGEAIAELKFFMSTAHGREHFEVVKEMGDLQEWSYGFDVKETGEITDELREKGVSRVLKKLKVHEVSPVLLGSGIGTRTLSVKSGEGKEVVEVNVAKPKGNTLGKLIQDLSGERDLSNGELGKAMGLSATEVAEVIKAGPPLALRQLEAAAGILKTSVARLRRAAEADGCDYAEEDSARARYSAAQEAYAAAVKAAESAEAAVTEAQVAVEAKTAAEAQAARDRAAVFQAEAKAEIAKVKRNIERYT